VGNICPGGHERDKERWFKGMQNQKAGFGMFLRESYTHGTKTGLQLEGFSCNLMFEFFFQNLSRKFNFH
jgi:hypothetical protein